MHSGSGVKIANSILDQSCEGDAIHWAWSLIALGYDYEKPIRSSDIHLNEAIQEKIK